MKQAARAAVVAAVLLAPGAASLDYVDVTKPSGITFQHSGPDWRFDKFPEVTGSGVCWADVDQDGFDDLFFVNNKYWNATRQALYKPKAALYANNGDGTFRDETAHSGLGYGGWGQGCGFGDYDGDGDPDLYLSSYDQDVLYRNEGDGRFTNVTLAAGVDDTNLCGDYACWGTGVAWFDYDRDGDLDLYVGNYVAWDGINQAAPYLYSGQRDLLWRNDGDGTFTEVSDEAGVRGIEDDLHSKSFAVVVNDYNLDGWPDIFVACDEVVDYLYRNNGDGTFTDVAQQAGVDDIRAGMGAEFEDLTLDGWPDIFITHYHDQHNAFYVNQRDGTFDDEGNQHGLEVDTPYVAWATGFHDFDNDGDNDIYIFNGHTKSHVGNYHMPHLLLRNDSPPGGFAFTNVTGEAGTLFTNATVGRGGAVADYDWDGILDIAQNNNGNGTAKLGRGANVTGHWLALLLRQGGANVHGIDARVTVTDSEGRAQVRHVRAGHSYLSQDGLALHFGFGDRRPVRAEVRWPDGAVQEFAGLPVDGVARLHRATGAVVSDTLAPVLHLEVRGTPAANGYWREVRGFALAATDRAVGPASGVAALAYLDPDSGSWLPYAGPVDLAMGQGAHEVRARAEDHAGNTGGAWPFPVVVDAVPPVSRHHVVGPGGGGWYQPSTRVVLNATDDVSGVQAIYYRVDGGPWTLYERSFRLPTSRAHAVEWYAVDRAGNVEPAHGALVYIDGEPPILAVAEPPGFGVALGDIRVRVAMGDALSGPARVAFYLDQDWFPRHVDSTPEDGFTWVADLGAEPGLHRLRVAGFDHAGNRVEDRSTIILALPRPASAPGGAGPWR